MQTLSRLLLLSAFFATGVSLECETCTNTSKSCTGRMKTCAAHQDTCIISLVENGLLSSILGTVDPSSVIPGIKTEVHSKTDGLIQGQANWHLDGIIHVIEKGCEGFPVCEFGDVYMNIGRNRTLRGSTFCCKGAACQKISPKLPPRHTTPNGRQCPACFTTTRGCPDETVNCTGPEEQCFAVKLNAKLGPLGVIILRATVKGCATKSFCDISQTGGKMYGRLGFYVEEYECHDASKGPGSFEHPFLILLGLLIMKFLV